MQSKSSTRYVYPNLKPSAFSNHVSYSIDVSPNHLQKPGIYLKNLRKREETCDIIFVLEGEDREYLHSALAGGHSSKLARLLSKCGRLPLIMDLTSYHPYCVHKLVEWMYTGEITYRLQYLADLLVLASDMGTVFLHRQLESTLCQQAQLGHVVTSLNIATCLGTGVSQAMVNDCVRLVLARQKTDQPLSLEEIQGLTPGSVAAMAASRLDMEDKTHLINLALNWLRFNPLSVGYIIDQIDVPKMAESDLQAFKMTLASSMSNPYSSRGCHVWIKPGDNFLSIGTKCKETTSNSASRSESIEGHSLSKEPRFFTRSEIKDINKIPDVFVDEDNFTKWERRDADYSASTNSHIRGLKDPFEPKQVRSFTRSEMEDIRRLPNQFSNIVPNCTDCSKSQESITGSSASTASLMSQGTLEEARQMQMTTIGKHDRHDEAQQIHAINDVSFSEEPKQVNSTYANVPKAATSSFYAL